MSVNTEIARKQAAEQEAARKALLENIAALAPKTSSPSMLLHLAQAYALVVAPEHAVVTTSAS